jgi:hypothetical protein
LRLSIGETLQAVVPKATITLQDGGDISDLLDNNPNLRRSFPQLLSLRDLDALIEDALGKESRERSRAAVSAAQEVSPVFVPTTAYNKTWTVLAKHNFAVLKGPPEVGKTAIAWMIALAQCSHGWEAIVCDEPSHFFTSLKADMQQVFVADDAFGRTEYEPARGLRWERDLDRVLRSLDKRHWLLWTSRKHNLERARHHMDLQCDGRHFPNPAAVLVNAANLSEEEKAIMLYRHARAASLEAPAKILVRAHAPKLVHDASFTPERIRRFVQESLPQLVCELATGRLTADKVEGEIREAIRNPTDRMRKSFRALSPGHKWLLISMLEAGFWPQTDVMRESYKSYRPDGETRDFDELLEELSESFIKPIADGRSLDWTHPSYRDLIIEEMTFDVGLKKRFLEKMSLNGIQLAISDTGGARGDRKLPVMDLPESWQLLRQRCVELASQQASGCVADLLDSLASAAQHANGEIRSKIVEIIASASDAVKQRWDVGQLAFGALELRSYFDSTLLVAPLPASPKLENAWLSAEALAAKEIEGAQRSGYLTELDSLKEWVDLTVVIHNNEPRFLLQREFPSNYTEMFGSLMEVAKTELDTEPIHDDSDELASFAEHLGSLADMLSDLSELGEEHEKKLEELSKSLSQKAESVKEEIRESEGRGEPPYEPDDDGGRSGAGARFDIAALFSDL